SWLELLAGKGLKDSEEFLASGAKITQEIVTNFPELVTAELLLEGQTGFLSSKNQFVLKKELFAELDIFGTKKPLLVVKQKKIEKFSSYELPPGPTLLLPFQDPANIGAAVRSACAFGCKNILLSQESANPFHPKSVRASSGMILHCSFIRGGKLVDWLAQWIDFGAPVYALDMQGTPLPQVSFPKSYILAAGEEGQGLPLTSGMRVISIPMAAGVESLNAATSIGIALYEATRE
ncbi:MAG: TrmH family RNA methyltransferase, partial [Pseudobdellovibrionaceae bacterium]